MKILHSADWQLGCAFSKFGSKAPALRAQRLATLRQALEIANRESVDAFLIAGDLFEDNQVAQSLLDETAALFTSRPHPPIFILPGNHDPVSGPGCIWRRPPFSSSLPNVTIILEAGVYPLGGDYLIANPLRQKLSTQDPSARLCELAAGLPAAGVKVGMTHGALAIDGKHQPNDHPIHLQAATRARLDYLALGHWHGWQTFDGDRIVMPGTPEPDAFDHAEGRFVAMVEIPAPGAPPQIRRIEVAGLCWRQIRFDFIEGDAGRRALRDALRQLEPDAARTVVRIMLGGQAPRESLVETRAWIEAALQGFAASEFVDESNLALSETEISALAQSNPLLAQVFADVGQARAFATGQPNSAEVGTGALTLAEFQRITGDLELDGSELNELFFKAAADVLVCALGEKAG